MDDIEKIKQKIDIVDLVSEFVSLKRAGRNFRAPCPFHNEKSPSFTVSPERQIWHCFGCGKGGDIFTFLEEFEKIDFSEALKFLAQKAGITLTQSVQKNEREKSKEKIYTINFLTSQFYSYLLLNHPVGKEGLAYLTEKRKIPLELIKKFQIGFAPSSRNILTTYLMKKKNYSADDLMLASVASKTKMGLIDFFKDRIIFPLFDTREHIIAFSGRALTDDNQPKYINSRETPVYKKGDTLFGLHLAKEAIKKEKQAILVEGEFDVISSFKEGIQNIVAIKGTALTESQIKLLKRYTEKISFCFDTDAAGVEAQRRSIALIEKEGVNASVIIPPEGKDPDELLKENPLLFKKALKHEVSIYDYIIDTAHKNLNVNNPEGKKKMLLKTLPYIALIENEVVKEHYLKKIAHILDSTYESVAKQLEKTAESKTPITAPPTLPVLSPEEKLESYFIALLLQAPNRKTITERAGEILGPLPLTLPLYQKLYHAITTSSLELSIPDFAATLPAELMEGFDRCYLLPLPHFETEGNYLYEVEQVAEHVKSISIKKQLSHITEQIKQKHEDPEELVRLEKDFAKLTGLLQTRSQKKKLLN